MSPAANCWYSQPNKQLPENETAKTNSTTVDKNMQKTHMN